MTERFVNLHIHSEYSALDGYIRIQQMVDKVASFGQKACALTDHGTLAGTAEFYRATKKAGIKPIIGFEAYVVPDRHAKPERGRARKKGEKKPNNGQTGNKHLVLLAKNEEGYRNLLKLHSEGYRHQIQIFARSVPRVDHELLQRHGKGLIATSACLGSEFAALIRNKRYNEAKTLVKFYRDIFDDFFLEVQPARTAIEYANDHTQEIYNTEILRLAKELKVPVIVTTDSHYAEESDRDAHQLLLAIQSKCAITNPCRLTFEAPPMMCERSLSEEFDKSIVHNTEMIADLCEDPEYLQYESTDSPDYKLPPFEVTGTDAYAEWKQAEPATSMQRRASATQDETRKYFYFKIDEGWENKKLGEKHGEQKEIYAKRLEYECDVITGMGFPSYFLIVSDIGEFCDRENIRRGVGRGSAAGSLIGYLLNIHKLDPIKYDLLFERFLNPSRISMPDIDSDFDRRERPRVREYIIEKYGADRVANIATFGRMKVRGCIKDIIRSLELGGDKQEAFRLADAISKSIHGGDETTLAEVMDPQSGAYSAEFLAYMEKYPQVAKYIKCYESYTDADGGHHPGIIRQSGIHAAGIIIGVEPLDHTLPMMTDKNGVRATAYDDKTLEKLGYLKLDILGLNTLTVISDTVKNIKKVRDEDFKRFPVTSIPYRLNESKQEFLRRFKEASENQKQATRAYHLLRQGNTAAIFQLEGSGMTSLCVRNKVNSIEDIAAVIALGRPGPLESGDTIKYSERKFGRAKTKYLHPSLQPILEPTFGVLVYQEQCMRIAVDCAGFSLPEADNLRKGIGKKIKKEISKLETLFIKGCQRVTDMSKETASAIWQNILGFARYGFNKSHAVCYAMTAYQTAFLKANYPAEFWAAVLSNEGDREKVNVYFREVQATGIEALPVNINESGLDLIPTSKKTLRRSLTALNGIGPTVVQEIIKKRPYTSVVDFLNRVDARRVNSGAVISLVKAGAFDDAFDFENYNRKVYYDYAEDCRAKLKKIKSSKEREQFQYNWSEPVTIKKARNGAGARTLVEPKSGNKDKKWSFKELLQHETEVYGMPVSGHPFDEPGIKEHEDRFNSTFKHLGIFKLSTSINSDNYLPGDKVYLFVRIQGILAKRPYKKDKKKFMRRLAIEDRFGRGELTVFDHQYDEKAFDKGEVVAIIASIDEFNGRRSLKLEKTIKI